MKNKTKTLIYNRSVSTCQAEANDPPGLYEVIENLLPKVSDTKQAVKFVHNLCYGNLKTNCAGLWPNQLTVVIVDK